MDGRDFLALADGRRIIPTCRYHRVFNVDFTHGGRWYGPWWQSVRKAARPAITIDGAATVEIDFACCHPRLLCAIAGIDLPFGDPEFDFYAVRALDRRWVKLVFNVFLNADRRRKRIIAARDHLTTKFGTDVALRLPHIAAALDSAYPRLRPFWNSGIGLCLQNIDAQICTGVQRRLRAAGIPCLSVHDSFVVPGTVRFAL